MQRNKDEFCYGEVALRKTLAIFPCKINPVELGFLRNTAYGSSVHICGSVFLDVQVKTIKVKGDEVHTSKLVWNPQNITAEKTLRTF